jgi:hypothetical protein
VIWVGVDDVKRRSGIAVDRHRQVNGPIAIHLEEAEALVTIQEMLGKQSDAHFRDPILSGRPTFTGGRLSPADEQQEDAIPPPCFTG